MTHAAEKSDSPIVPGKPTNKADPPVAESVAEPVEGRGGAPGHERAETGTSKPGAGRRAG